MEGLKLRQILRPVLPPDVLKHAPNRFEVVGDICVLRLRREVLPYAQRIGEALIRTVPGVRVVAVRTGATSGEERVAPLMVVAGEERTETVHREHGCLFRVDLSKVYFTPKLSFEHQRVALQVKPGETVFNMFSGVGGFSIPIARRVECRVYSVDVNPYAIRYLKENIALNRVEGRVIPVLGDAAEFTPPAPVDRVLMPLPAKAYDYLGHAVGTVKNGGVIHYYDVVVEKGGSPLKELEWKVVDKLEKLGFNAEVVYGRCMRSIAPRRRLAVLDVKVRKDSGGRRSVAG
ncbi:MAG: class I SAM-dependent methyltransferase [Candidatus Freyarchaeota archaeon]|nr:class I SAM-dependent methyltransferase family protein [Candidatus Freyrarchaeum guaymaensis]